MYIIIFKNELSRRCFMRNVRIIPRLDVKGSNVVKGIRLEGLRVLGKPAELAKQYYEQGADEILYIDIVASLYERNNLSHVVKEAISLGVYVPMAVGGGIRTLEDIQELLHAGADKVAINTAATRNPRLITDAARRFGSQCIIGSVEAKKVGPERWEAYVDNGRERTGLDAVEWAVKLVELGAGELLITSVDRDGCRSGYDLELIRTISQRVSVPVIASGGAGNPDDVVSCAVETACDALAVGSILHYKKATIPEIKTALEKTNLLFRKNHESIPKVGDASPKEKVISIIDYGVGNIMSVISAFQKIGCQVKVVCTPWEIKEATHVVLPGVGAYGEGMAQLEKRGLASAIKEYVASGKPLLGICLGAQLLLSESQEFGVHKGLGIVKGKVVGFKKPQEVNIHGYRVPHIVWNSLVPVSASAWKNTILADTPPEAKLYFIHSYYIVPDDQSVTLATAEYGQQRFCAAFKQGNVYGCQFHPEKSGNAGLEMISLFANL